MIRTIVVSTIAAAALAVPAAFGGEQQKAAGGKKDASQAQSAAGGTQDRERTFLTLDENRDAKVTRQEAKSMPSLAQRFDKVDADGDGTLSRYEFNTFMSR